MIDQADLERLVDGGLSAFVDRLQLELIGIGDRITQTWFRTAPTAAAVSGNA